MGEHIEPTAKPTASRAARPKYYLSVCCIFKNEAEYIEEWLRFYDLLGVEHFYLYDNVSMDGYADVLAPWIAAGRVSLYHIDMPAPQLPAYSHCILTLGHESRWIAFLDVDEFLFSPIQTDLRHFLEPFENQAAVAANWVLFGPSGHQNKPPGLVTLSYTLRSDTSLCTFEAGLLKQPQLDPLDPRNYHPICSHVKSIVNAQEVVGVYTPHHFAYRNDRLAVSAAGRPIRDSFSDEVAIDVLRVNHYHSRSWEEFRRKIQRGRADGGTYDAPGMTRVAGLFDRIRDTTIFPLAEKVRAAIASHAPVGRSEK